MPCPTWAVLANGRLLGVQMVANELVAPPLGGLLFATAAALPFLLDAGSFAAAVSWPWPSR